MTKEYPKTCWNCDAEIVIADFDHELIFKPYDKGTTKRHYCPQKETN